MVPSNPDPPKQVNGTMRTLRTTLASGFLVLCTATPAVAQAPTPVAGKKPLDHEAYDIWNRITTQAISDDGRYVLYVQTSEANDPRLFVKDAATGATLHEIERGDGAQFTDDSRFVIYRLKPSKAAVKPVGVRRQSGMEKAASGRPRPRVAARLRAPPPN